MKFVHLFPVFGIAAALGASHARPGSSSHALAHAAPPAGAGVTPPWLAEGAVEGGLGHSAHEPHEPHANPHGHDPHAGTSAAGHDEGVCPELEPLAEEAVDPYRRVGLAPAPELRVARLERSRASNGHTIAGVHAARQELAGKPLRVRGTVVKRNDGILGKTYLHLRDGSGSAERGDDDLTVTTSEAFELGETVELEGELAIDQDVGAGYFYPALLTNAARVAP